MRRPPRSIEKKIQQEPATAPRSTTCARARAWHPPDRALPRCSTSMTKARPSYIAQEHNGMFRT